MNWIKRLLPLLLFLATCTSWAQSAAPSWHMVLPKGKHSCTKSAPCWIKQEKSDENLRVVFQTRTEGDVTSVDSIEIKNAKTQEVAKFKPADLAGILPSESFQLFSVDVNKDGFTDLALFAFSSPRGGPLFYYFLFDPKTHQFVMSDDPLPELKAAPGPKFTAREGDGSFSLGADLKLKSN